MRKLRWGVLSTAKIGMQKVIPAMQKSQYCDMVAIASRRSDSAERAAKTLGIAKSYDSYEALLNAADIEAVYIPLPNHLHVPWSIKALEAGKHVLCEKPVGLSSADAQKLIDAAARHPQLKVMEAFMYRFHPQWQWAKEQTDNGSIGELKAIQSVFSYYNDDPGNIRNMADTGGGGLMDVGCYTISLSRFLFGHEPRRVCGTAEYDPRFKTDRIASGILDFGNGTSQFICSTQLVPAQRVNIFGSKGRLEIEIPFNAPPDKPCRVWHQSGKDVVEIDFEVCNQYTIQGDLFSEAVLKDRAVPTPPGDALGNMQVIEALAESDRAGQWVSLAANS